MTLTFIQERQEGCCPPVSPEDTTITLSIDPSLEVSYIIKTLEETMPHLKGLRIPGLKYKDNFVNPLYPLARMNVKDNDCITVFVVTEKDAETFGKPKDESGFDCSQICVICCCCYCHGVEPCCDVIVTTWLCVLDAICCYNFLFR
jgi:hypothetical protein